MKVNYNELQIAFDVDYTLVMHGLTNHPGAIPVRNPYTDETHYLVPHPAHVRMIKHHHARGYYVTVHSNDGAKWAEVVIRALGLTAYVGECKSKYIKFVDDKDAADCMGKQVYIPFEA